MGHISAIVLSIVLIGCSSLSGAYVIQQNSGTVIDEKTKHPIEGVIVLEVWDVRGGDIEEGHIDNLVIRETRTDAEGVYRFSNMRVVKNVNGKVSNFAPHLVFIKNGYEYKALSNARWELIRDEQQSKWNGSTITLNKFKGDDMAFFNELRSYYNWTGYNNSRAAFVCMWSRIPMYSNELFKRKSYIDKKIKNNLPNRESMTSGECLQD